MNEQEVFIDEYGLDFERPNGDYYLVLYKDGKELGGINTAGHNLLTNLYNLCNIIKCELS